MVVLSRCVRTSPLLFSNLKIAVPRTEGLIIDRYYHYWGCPEDKNINFVSFAVTSRRTSIMTVVNGDLLFIPLPDI
uniref:Uncharacterized protein n=1 Tax=Onchocerca volvulus TaxID=6282 RepID=A0A8R1XNG3_ONCVO